MTESRIFTLCRMIAWVLFLRMFWNFVSSLPVKRGGSLSFLVGRISNVLVMEIGLTDVGSGGYILVSCAHSNTSLNSTPSALVSFINKNLPLWSKGTTILLSVSEGVEAQFYRKNILTWKIQKINNQTAVANEKCLVQFDKKKKKLQIFRVQKWIFVPCRNNFLGKKHISLNFIEGCIKHP